MNAPYLSRFSWRGAILIGLCFALLLHSGCGGRRSQQYTDQGETYLLIGNVQAAQESFNRAFDLDPTNARAKMGLARCLWLDKKPQEAIATYLEAIELDPNLEKAYMEAARISVVNGDVPGAHEIVDRFKNVDPIAGGILEGYVLRETGDVDGAITVLSALSAQYPEAADVRVNLASAYHAADRFDEAEEELHTVLDTLDGSSLAARMLLVEVYQAQGKAEEIVTELRNLASEQPNNDNIQLALARSLLAAQRFDEAEAIAQPILDRTPESPWANFVVGACLLEEERYAEAIDCLSAAFGGLPNEPAVANMLAIAQRGGREESQAVEPAVADATPEKPDDDQASWQDLWNEASLRELLARRESFLRDDPSPELAATLLFAAVFTQDGNTARSLVDGVPEERPERKFVEDVIAQDWETAKQTLDNWEPAGAAEKILRGNARGFFFAMGGSRAQALDVFTQTMVDHPGNGVALYNIASMYRSVGMPKFAVAALRQLIVRHGRNREARQLLFDVLMQADEDAEARQLAESTYAIFPEDPFAALMLARAYRDAGESGLALEVLQRGLERDPGTEVLSVALAEVLAFMGDYGDVQAVLDKVDTASAYALQIAVLRAFAAASQDDWDTVLTICEQHAGAAYPNALRLLHVAALINTGSSASPVEPLLSADGSPINSPATTVLLAAFDRLPGEAGPEDASLAEALKNDPDSTALFAHALACRETRLFNSAYSLFQELEERLPAKPRVVTYLLSSLAMVSEIADRAAIATGYTEEYPALAAAWLGLADVEHALDDFAAERAALEKAVEVAPENAEAWLRYARFMDEQSDMQGQLRAYRKLATLLPEDPFIANNLAYCILQEGGDTAEALTLAQGAFEKVNTNASILHTLGLAQLKSGDLDEASKHLRFALEMRPGDPTLLLDAGKALLAQNKEKEGRDYITYALHYAKQLGVDFPGKPEAERLLAGG
ncbi:MAG: hypothetical protein AMXMBFR82_04710 [Candidatus Hydrogenedentota bacterium]